MKKGFFLLIIAILLGITDLFAQYPNDQQGGNTNGTTMFTQRGGIRGLTGFVFPNFIDTAEANSGYISAYSGACIFTISDTSLWYRDVDAQKWIKVGSGSGGGSAIDTTGKWISNVFERNDTIYYQLGASEFVVHYIDTAFKRFEVDSALNALIAFTNKNTTDTIIYEFDGSGGGGVPFDTTYIYQAIATKLNIADTTNKWVSTLYVRNDSIFFNKGGVETFLHKDNKFDTTNIYNILATKLNIADTTGKWVGSVYLDGDTLRYKVGNDTYTIGAVGGEPNFPTVNDTISDDRHIYHEGWIIDFYTDNFRTRFGQDGVEFQDGIHNGSVSVSNGLHIDYSSIDVVIDDNAKEIDHKINHGSGSDKTQHRMTTTALVSSITRSGKSSNIITTEKYHSISAGDSVLIAPVLQTTLDTAKHRFVVINPNGKLEKVSIPSGGGSPDTIKVKAPLMVDENDTLRIVYPAKSVAVNLTSDSADVQFLPIDRELIKLATDTIRWTSSGTLPNGTQTVYYQWSRIGSMVYLTVWGNATTQGTSVTAAAVDLPSDCPAPQAPTPFLTGAANEIWYVGHGDIYQTTTRTVAQLTSNPASVVLKVNDAGTKFELVWKRGSGGASYFVGTFIYKTND